MENILILISEKMFVLPFTTGFLFVIVAAITLVFPPKKINLLYGYRTRASMKNQQVWDFAQRYSGVKMAQIGLVLMAFSLLNVVFGLNDSFELMIGLSSVVIACAFLFLATESAIRKKFPNQL
jgi:uncharacterized membrane protein